MGKTVLSELEIAGKAFAKGERNIFYVATTYQQARDIAWQGLRKIVEPIIVATNESRLEIEVRTQDKTNTIIQLRGWENIETLRGQKADFIVIDEIASMKNFWVNWEEVIRPTLTDTVGEVLFISTPKGYNHFYELCNRELKDKDYKSFHFTSYDNPYLPKEELETAKQTLSPETFLQEYMGEFQKTQGLVYKEFNRKRHLYKDIPNMELERIAGVDFGFRNPAAVLDIRTDGERFWVEDEWYKQERTDLQIAEYVAQNRFEEVYPDPESPGAIEELKRKNVNIREVIKGKDSVEVGIKRIKELLISNKLKVNARCINLISEFEMYTYDDKKEGNQPEKPLKANDHALDALRYVILMKRPEEKLKQFKQHYSTREDNSSR